MFNDISRLPSNDSEIQDFKNASVKEKNVHFEKQPNNAMHVVEAKKPSSKDIAKNASDSIQKDENKNALKDCSSLSIKDHVKLDSKLDAKPDVIYVTGPDSKKQDHKNKIVCYTCITKGYDDLLDPYVKSSGIDFICFSDKEMKSDIWKWRKIPDELACLDSIRQ